MSSSFLEQVGRDFDALGLEGVMPDVSPDVWSWEDLYTLLSRTALLDSRLIAGLDLGSLEINTPLGQKALEVIADTQERVTFGGILMECCRSAEGKLMANIGDESVAVEGLRSPVVITDGDEPIGIIKGMGEKSCYSLVDHPASGLIEGCFAEPSEEMILTAESLPKIDTAWSLPIEAAGRFQPLRFGSFTLGVPNLEQIAVNEARHGGNPDVLFTSHGQILKRADEMLEQARPVELEVLQPAVS